MKKVIFFCLLCTYGLQLASSQNDSLSIAYKIVYSKTKIKKKHSLSIEVFKEVKIDTIRKVKVIRIEKSYINTTFSNTFYIKEKKIFNHHLIEMLIMKNDITTIYYYDSKGRFKSKKILPKKKFSFG